MSSHMVAPLFPAHCYCLETEFGSVLGFQRDIWEFYVLLGLTDNE